MLSAERHLIPVPASLKIHNTGEDLINLKLISDQSDLQKLVKHTDSLTSCWSAKRKLFLNMITVLMWRQEAAATVTTVTTQTGNDLQPPV